MSEIIKIRSEDELNKWVGRRVRLGWGRDGLWQSTQNYVGMLRRYNGVNVHVGDCSNHGWRIDFSDPTDFGWIELLDGAAYPRPEGEGWVWIPTAADARPFEGKRCEVSAGPLPLTASGRHSVFYDLCISNCGGWLDDPNGPSVAATMRGGAWIRELPPEPVIDPAQAKIDRLTEEIAEAEKVLARTRQECAERVEIAEARLGAMQDLRTSAIAQRDLERASEELPEGWQWGRQWGLTACCALSIDGRVCYIGVRGDLVTFDPMETKTHGIPAEVVRAVLERAK
jgi:hypothetical protein